MERGKEREREREKEGGGERELKPRPPASLLIKAVISSSNLHPHDVITSPEPMCKYCWLKEKVPTHEFRECKSDHHNDMLYN